MPVHTLADFDGQAVCAAIERSHATAGRHLLQAVAVSVKLGHDALCGVFPRRAGHDGLGVGGKAVAVAEIQVQFPRIGAASCAADQHIRLAVAVDVAGGRQRETKACVRRAVKRPRSRARHAAG